MGNREIRERLSCLRNAMKRQGVDYYLITTGDYHNCEYVNDFFKVREYFCGFTGSNGTLLVWQDGAGLWTDGRYFVQAQKELEGSGVELYRMGMEKVPALAAFLKEHLSEGQTLGFYGKCVTAKAGQAFLKLAEEKKASLVYDRDLAGELWKDRPAFPHGSVTVLPEDVAGEKVCTKLSKVRKELEKAGAQALFLAKLDDIMWLFNIRGCDVECNPVAMAYAYVTMQKAAVFLQKEAVTEEVKAYLQEQGVLLLEYGTELEYLLGSGEESVLLDAGNVSFYAQQLLGSKKIVAGENPTERLKAIKSETELKHMRRFYLLDSIAVTKFIYWLKCKADVEALSELDAAERLDSLRREIPGFLDLSFPTISAYGANAAMMHYETTPENHAMLHREGFLLVDSGAQYLGATTDVTRTISLGKLSEEMREHYTRTAKGMLSLSNAVFLHGCTGRNVDILARAPLWERGVDYRCGTGHGVGYILNVHEGPHSIRWKYEEKAREAVLEEGMVVTNEPGVYLDGRYGIRIENVMAVAAKQTNEYGKFLQFETLTYVPLDAQALEFSLLDRREREWVNEYQAKVFQTLSPYLTPEEKEWLSEETKKR